MLTGTATDRRLNTLFVRYGCGTQRQGPAGPDGEVLIPYSSGMGVGLDLRLSRRLQQCLNTLFVRYGCGTHYQCDAKGYDPVLIPYSSGMGVGR